MITKTDVITAVPLDIYDDLRYCMQEWQGATEKAVEELATPEPDTSLEWTVALFGNLLWALTVFFPPAFAVEGAVTVGAAVAEKLVYATSSRATQIASMAGATLAAGVGGKLVDLRASDAGNLNSAKGKIFLGDFLGTQVPAILKISVDGSTDFTGNQLIWHLMDHYVKTLSAEAVENSEDYTDRFVAWISTTAGKAARAQAVWEKYVFQNPQTPYDNGVNGTGELLAGGRVGLKRTIAANLATAVTDYRAQWVRASNEAYEYARKMINAYQYGAAGQEGAYFEMLKIAAQQYMNQHPFQPTISYTGVPSGLQKLQQVKHKNLQVQVMQQLGNPP